MDSTQREELRHALLEQREALAGGAAVHTQEGFSLGLDGSQDVGDDAANAAARQLLLGLGERERQQLREIEDALERLDEDEYGLCAACGEEIAAARLRLLPHALLCVECKATEEQLRPR